MRLAARHLNLFPPQIIQHRELMNAMVQANGGTTTYNAQEMRLLGIPCGSLPENQLYHQPACEAKTSVNTDSGLTYNISAPRKRSRDAFNQFQTVQNFVAPTQQKSSGLSQLPPVAGEDFLPQLHQYQFEMDAIISQHTKKIRLELEERQKYQARLLATAIGEGVMKKLKEKDEQIHRMSKLNLVLQERVKSLYIENQLWRDLAQTNEATANSLRSNLEQVLQNVGGEERLSAGAVAVEDDVESCCGSSNGGGDAYVHDKEEGSSSGYGDRRCRMCGERESCVLLLPCRHLCLCSVCGSGSQQLQSCPVCSSSMTATLHVNMS